MKINVEALRERGKYISENHHPKFPLVIWNYTKLCQFEKAWDDYTEQCRGLITTLDGEVVSRPFRKFYNINERPETTLAALPAVRPEVYEKVDGSLGISYFYQGVPYIATRGSFTSEQSEWANSFLRGFLRSDMLRREYTYLFECVYPSNRIVVDYGRRESLVLLAVIHTSTGKEFTSAELLGEAERIGTVAAKSYPYTAEEALKQLERLNGTMGEGFVLRYPNGLRVKAKGDDYKRLHFLLTNFSTKSIWQCLRDETDFTTILDAVPDEFYGWVTTKKQNLEKRYNDIYVYCKETAEKAKSFKGRSEQASFVKKEAPAELRGITFSILDGKPCRDAIFRLIRPDYERPFKTEA